MEKQYLQGTDDTIRRGLYDIQQTIMQEYQLSMYNRSNCVRDILKCVLKNKERTLKELRELYASMVVIENIEDEEISDDKK